MAERKRRNKRSNHTTKRNRKESSRQRSGSRKQISVIDEMHGQSQGIAKENDSVFNNAQKKDVVEDFTITYEEERIPKEPIVFEVKNRESFGLPEMDSSLPVEELALPIVYEDWPEEVTTKQEPTPAPEVVEVKEEVEEKPKKRIKVWKIIFAILLLALVGAGYEFYRYISGNLKDVPELNIQQIYDYSKATDLYGLDGEYIASYGANENIEWAEFEELPENLVNAVISIEDKRFYEHHGIDIRRLISAVWGQLTNTSSHGASTLTQQLVKNTYLSQEVTYKRKIQEIYLALQLEQEISKEDILEAYVNTIFLGDSNYGVKVAARDYFGKELNELTLRECATLAGLAQSPNEYNPRLNMLKGDMGPTNYRTDTVLYAMHENEKISDEEYEAALEDLLIVRQQTSKGKLYAYPAYIEYAIENVAKELLRKEGKDTDTFSIEAKKAEIRQKGYRIEIALEPEMQDILQDTLLNFNNYPRVRDGSEVEASAVIMDQHNGRVVALVGGRHPQTEPEVFNRATDSAQPVGSSMKPLSVYAPALDTGCHPGSTVMDIKEKIDGFISDTGYPGGPTDGGAITMRRALEQSHNVPAVRFLLEEVGIDRSKRYLVKSGFEEEHIDLDLTPAGLGLGAASVTTMEMTAGYATLANGGVYIEPHAFVTVYDRNGEVILEEDDVDHHRVYRESTAWLITDIMHTNMTNGLGVNANIRGMTVAGKTGTHEDKVITFGGYTPYYTSFVRISSDNYISMYRPSSYYQSSVLWRSYMAPIHAELEDKPIQEKSAEELGIQRYYVCSNSGQLAKADCPGHYEYAAPNNAPTEYCSEHKYWHDDEAAGGYMSWWDEFGNFHENGWWDENGNFYLY